MPKKKLFNLPDKEYQFWKPIIIDGNLYSFDHLSATKHRFLHPDRNEHYIIYLTISHHVFTVDIKKSDRSHSFIYPHKPEDRRYFCAKRYKLSFHLPEILKTLPNQFCYHGGYGRYCICQLDDGCGNTIYYQVVFRAWRSSKKLRFHIESAYPLDAKPKTKKVNFWIICHNLLNNKKLPKP